MDCRNAPRFGLGSIGMSRGLVALAMSFTVAMSLPVAGRAQQNAVPTLTVNARLVVVDVVVTDKAGRPVEGLTQKDFHVYEDGRLQNIRSFEVPGVHALPETTLAEGAGAVFDPGKPASFGRSPVTVLVMDQLNTHFADSSFARRSVREYLMKQPAVLAEPTTLLTVYNRQFHQLQAFTRDRAALLKAIDGAPVKYAWELEVKGATEFGPVERLDQSLRALEEIAESFASIPGRKNLVWVGTGYPTIDPTVIDGDDAQEVKDTLQHVTDVLLQTRVTVYAVDPASLAASVTEVTNDTQADFVENAGDGLAMNADPFNSDQDFDRLGPVTGGRVVRGMNDVAAQIGQAVADGSEFYTIGYAPDNAGTSAADYRKIRVECLKPGLTAVTRSGYYGARTEKEKSVATAGYDLATAAESSIPLHGLEVSVTPSGAGTYLVKVGANRLTWAPEPDGSSQARVYVMAASLDAKGKLVGHTLKGMIASAKPGTNLRADGREAEFAFPAETAKKAATLRFVVRDSSTGTMGSFDLPVGR